MLGGTPKQTYRGRCQYNEGRFSLRRILSFGHHQSLNTKDPTRLHRIVRVFKKGLLIECLFRKVCKNYLMGNTTLIPEANLPLPSAPESTPGANPIQPAFTQSWIVPWRLWGALFLFVPVADFCLYGIKEPGAGLVVVVLAGALGALYVSRMQGRIRLGLAVLLPSLAAMLLGPSLPNTISLVAGVGILAWVHQKNDLPQGLAKVLRYALAAPLVLLVQLAKTLKALMREKQDLHGGKKLLGCLGNFLKLSWPAFLVSGLFLMLLANGNVILSQKVGDVLQLFLALLGRISCPDFFRIFFWFAAVLGGALFFVPALQCKCDVSRRLFFESRRKAGTNPGHDALRWVFTLAGVNLVFLFTNTLDVIYLWYRCAPPDGVNTTEYLHEGVYALTFATLLAGGMLAYVFNGGASQVGRLRALGVAWIMQNIFLISGVAFRLWLHVDSSCLTPRRMGVALFLMLVLAGFALLLIYMLRAKSLRWLFTGNVAAVLSLFFVVQFLDIEALCVVDALARRKAKPSLPISSEFLRRTGLKGWRLVWYTVEKENGLIDAAPLASGTFDAKECWDSLKRSLTCMPEAVPVPRWQSYSVRDSCEARELCEALGVPVQEPLRVRQAWVTAWKRANARPLRGR